MQFPPEFNALLRQFHQDFLLDTTLEISVENALISMGKKKCLAIKDFLDQLLSGPYDVEEIYRLWWASPSEISPADTKHIPALLKLIRVSLDSPRVQASPLP